MTESKKTLRGGMLMYPREYRITKGDPNKSIVIGVDEAGEPVAAILRPDEAAIERAKNSTASTVPELERFAQTHHRAKQPCRAAEDNGPDNPHGILLIEQIDEPTEEDMALLGETKARLVVGKWASIIRASREDLEPMIGYGYLETTWHPRIEGEAAMLMDTCNSYRIVRAIDAGEGTDPAEDKERALDLARALISVSEAAVGEKLKPYTKGMIEAAMQVAPEQLCDRDSVLAKPLALRRLIQVALDERIDLAYRRPVQRYLKTLPGFGRAFLNNPGSSPSAVAQHRSVLSTLLAGWEKVASTYGFDLSALEADEKAKEAYLELQRVHKKWFVGVVIDPAELREHLVQYQQAPMMRDLQAKLVELLSLETRQGVYRGVLIRVHRDGEVDTSLSTQVSTSYDYRRRSPKTPHQAVDEFIRYNGKRLAKALRQEKGISIDLIPTHRINCGPMGQERYNKEMMRDTDVPKPIKTFVEKRLHNDPIIDISRECGYLYSRVAVRLAEIIDGNDEGNQLLSAFHAYSPAIGNALEIGVNGGRAFRLDRRPRTHEKESEPAQVLAVG